MRRNLTIAGATGLDETPLPVAVPAACRVPSRPGALVIVVAMEVRGPGSKIESPPNMSDGPMIVSGWYPIVGEYRLMFASSRFGWACAAGARARRLLAVNWSATSSSG
jgi:hypothetical protein